MTSLPPPRLLPGLPLHRAPAPVIRGGHHVVRDRAELALAAASG